MKLLAPVLALCVGSTYGIGFDFGGSQVAILEEFKVPGDNPMYFCGDPKNDIAQISRVDLDPKEPQAGKPLSITAAGNLTETIEEGAQVKVQVKYGLITLINQQWDLCEHSDQVNLKCPVKKGKLSLAKDVDLPSQIPPGKYTITANATTKDNDVITCLTATIVFSRH